jgi:hypothetical protein
MLPLENAREREDYSDRDLHMDEAFHYSGKTKKYWI